MKTEKEKKGLGLYRRERCSHGIPFLLECWLVCDGTIKVSTSEITSEEKSGIWVKPLSWREFKIEDHKNFNDLYIHANNYVNKIIEDDEYFESVSEDHPVDEMPRFIASENISSSKDVYPKHITPDYMALFLLSNGFDYGMVHTIRETLIDRISNSKYVVPDIG